MRVLRAQFGQFGRRLRVQTPWTPPLNTRLSLFLNKNTRSGRSKNVDHIDYSRYSNHFISYKCKITHCLDSQTLSEYISTIVLDDNEKLSINECIFSVEVTHNLSVALMNNTPPKSFSVDFTHFHYFSSVFKHRTD